ncbi:hypothetical protein PT285_09845 [Lactobacillus sp. ESL0791]|uniref:hypothetical protein n=1 Tax=Lactobacillus sp. ESL0791 TaxID=2983234 RepID=UPI0023F81CFA|nr:hypothetical protein [Lactobacillus sp. ESL0791]MDF7639702.1 hypothetical protein [Lactobacillus sp. ESL0791]
MKTPGQAIHDVRIARRITQKTIAGNSFDRSAISKIEHDAKELTYNEAVFLIERMGLSQDEFQYIRGNYRLSPKAEIIYLFINYFNHRGSATVNDILAKCTKLAGDPDVDRISTIIFAVNDDNLNKSGGIENARKLIIPIWQNYLSKLETWNILDLYMLNGVFFIFDDDTTRKIANLAVKTINEKYPFLQELKLNFIINTAFVQMRGGDLTKALQNLHLAEDLAIELNRYDQLVFIKYRIALCQGDRKKVEDQIRLMAEMGDKKSAAILKMEIERYNYLFEK